MSERWYVYYPGHLGREPHSVIGPGQAVKWNQPVRLIPEGAARSLCTDGGFKRAHPLADAPLGLSVKQIRKLAESGELVLSSFSSGREGEKPVEVVIVDAPARRAALAFLAPPKPEPAQKEKE